MDQLLSLGWGSSIRGGKIAGPKVGYFIAEGQTGLTGSGARI